MFAEDSCRSGDAEEEDSCRRGDSSFLSLRALLAESCLRCARQEPRLNAPFLHTARSRPALPDGVCVCVFVCAHILFHPHAHARAHTHTRTLYMNMVLLLEFHTVVVKSGGEGIRAFLLGD